MLRAACLPDDLDLDAVTVERLWRAAGGAAHGLYWPSLELQRLIVADEYEPGRFRVSTLPDSTVMVEVIQDAYKMTQYGALKYLTYAGADLPALMGPAMRWLTDNMTLKPAVDPKLLERLTADRPAEWGQS